MSRKIRLIYFSLAIFIFIISAAAVIYYANGWRYDFSKNTFSKAGAISIQTDPGNTEVYINDVKYKATTPCTIRNLLPSSYQITLKKDGYFDWSETLEISSGTAYQLNGIILLKNQLTPKSLTSDSFDNLTPSSNNKYIAMSQGSEISVYDNSAAKIIYNKKLTSAVDLIDWSPLADDFVIKTKTNRFYILNTQSPNNEIELSTFLNEPIISAQWSVSENNIIYAFTGQGVYRINSYQKTSSLLTTDASAAYISDNYIFSAANGVLTIKLNGLPQQQVQLRQNASLKYQKLSSDWTAMIDQNNLVMWLFDTKNNRLEPIAQEVIGIPDLNNNLLFFYNQFEIWTLDLKTDEPTLILRTSDQITAADMLVPANYVIYAKQNGGLNILGNSPINDNTYQVPLANVSQIDILGDKRNVLVVSGQKPYLLHF